MKYLKGKKYANVGESESQNSREIKQMKNVGLVVVCDSFLLYFRLYEYLYPGADDIISA